MILRGCLKAIKVEHWEDDWQAFLAEHPHNRQAKNIGEKALTLESEPTNGPLEPVNMNDEDINFTAV